MIERVSERTQREYKTLRITLHNNQEIDHTKIISWEKFTVDWIKDEIPNPNMREYAQWGQYRTNKWKFHLNQYSIKHKYPWLWFAESNIGIYLLIDPERAEMLMHRGLGKGIKRNERSRRELENIRPTCSSKKRKEVDSLIEMYDANNSRLIGDLARNKQIPQNRRNAMIEKYTAKIKR